MTYLEGNKKAIDDIEKDYKKPIHEIADQENWTDLINYLRLLGLKCSKCGGVVTMPNFKFSNFLPSVLCWDCQQK